MQYADGKPIGLGDRVRLLSGETGTIVFSIDSNEYSDGFPKKEWEYLKTGVMVKTDAGALVHFKDPNSGDIERAP
jgi:hypothetical protein